MLAWSVSMSGYRVSFFKMLLSSDGHPFKCLQECIEVPHSETPAEAVDHASRTFEARHHVPDWTLHADMVEVVGQIAPSQEDVRSPKVASASPTRPER